MNTVTRRLRRSRMRHCVRSAVIERLSRAISLRWSVALLLAIWGATAVEAHNLGESYLYLQVYPEKISGRFEIALTDLNPALGLSGTDQEVSEKNLDDRMDFLRDYYLDHVAIASDQAPLRIEFTQYEYLNARGGFVLLPFELAGYDEVPELLTIDYAVLFDEDPDHRGFLLIEHNWATGTFGNENQISLIFSSGSRRQRLDLTSSGLWRGFLAVLILGIEHMLLGFDHALFLLALLLPAVLRREVDRTWQPVERFGTAWAEVVKVVGAFVVGHSLTLWLSALGWLQLPERWVEVIIAASIGLLAANILVPLFKQRLWLVVFGLALFHGLGFAAAISGLGVLGENLGLSLVAFNLGIEIGVLAIVLVLLPLLFLVRRSTLYVKLFLPLAAVSMLAISCIWVVERSFGLDFRLSKRIRSLFRLGAP